MPLSRVFSIRQAIVIGPTPPGTGVIAPAMAAASPNATSPTSRPSGSRFTPTSITVAPGAIQSPRTSSGRPTAATNDVCPAAFGGEIAGARMRDSDRGIGRHQQRGHRPAHDGRSSQHQGAGAFQRDAGFRQQLHHPKRRAGHQARMADRQAADIQRVEAVHVLAGSTASTTVCVSMCGGSGSCTRIPSIAGSAFSRATAREQRFLGRVGRQPDRVRRDAGGVCRAVLAADIDRAGRVLADQHDGEARANGKVATPASVPAAAATPCRR